MLLHEVRGWFRKQDVAFYLNSFVRWKERWTKCVQREGALRTVNRNFYYHYKARIESCIVTKGFFELRIGTSIVMEGLSELEMEFCNVTAIGKLGLEIHIVMTGTLRSWVS
ncbi:hypothetical protein LAZ67_23001517 [Cordylochernes scorpioides]|uniref:Uncharacterized protein n=1 Tax=Cordylochernes scorpioides TaxID=51811 RepID=A0ABY6LUS3_9ARAC|nr:hypothetical protein LAZ67_23001517 [Cordylochernes scorpioides]